MLGKTALALGIGAALIGVASTRASAQVVVGGYVAVPPLYVEIGPPPGLGYVWVPGHRRWGYRGAFDRGYYSGYYAGYRDPDWRDHREYVEHRRDYDRRDYDRRDYDRRDRDRDRR